MARRLSSAEWKRIAGSAQVRSMTRQRGNLIAMRARVLNDAEGGTANITVEHGVRPDGRSFTRVTSDNADEEYGTSKTRRRRVLRRAATGRG